MAYTARTGTNLPYFCSRLAKTGKKHYICGTIHDLLFMKQLLTFFAAAAVLAGTGTSLSAQEYIPRNEITINVSGGTNLGMMNVSGEYRADNPGFLPSCGAGLGFIHHFDRHWGFMTGVDAALYYFKAYSTDPDYVSIMSGMAYDDTTLPVGTKKAMCLFWHTNFTETALLGSIQVPLMLQFKAPLSDRIHFYAAGGATMALNLYGKYEQKVDKLEATPTLIEGYPFNSLIPGIDITGNVYKDNNSYKGDFDKNMFDVKASLELGLRWALSSGVGLYTGLFADYGLLAAFASGDYSIISDGSDQTGGTWRDMNALEDHSIFNSKTRPKIETTGTNLTSIDGYVGKPYIDPLHAGMAGLKVRFSFGKAKKAPKPAPAPTVVYVPAKADTVTKVVYVPAKADTVTKVVYVPAKADTVTKVVLVKDTVTVEKVKVVEKVVRDTVTIIKEVPVEIQRVMKDLSNTLFAFNKFDLNEKARGYLDEVAEWLKKNEDLKIEIAGHTDGIGGEEYNQKLSESRAKEVYVYFVEHGVNPANLSYKGYGKSQPIATNSTEEGRQQNRRVELKIL